MSGPQPSRRAFLQGTGAAVALASVPELARSAPSAQPNILFILADDLGFADLGCYGRRDYRTPAIDRLAAEGLLMMQGYANSAVCSPTRVALMTGRYHQRLPVGLPEPIRGRELDPVALPPNQATLPGLLAKAGFRTALVGKWHLGWPPQHGPLRYGYGRFFGPAAGGVDYHSHREHHLVDRNRPGLYEGEELVHRPGYLTDLLAERAVAEIRDSVSAGRPFLVSLHFTAPHWPWQGPDDAASSAEISNLRHDDGGSFEAFSAMMQALDAAVGRVLAELERAGVADNTIVIFTSDNGGERFSDTWPLRGGKGELLEGGIRVPVLVRWPARVPAGMRSDQLIATMDWLPTLVAAVGGSPDPAFPPDGENLLDVITGAAAARPRKLFWRFRSRNQAAARDGDWKYLKIEDREGLFHIPRDPRENTNLRVKEKQRFERLREEYRAWNATMLAYPPTQSPPNAPPPLRVGAKRQSVSRGAA